MSAAALLTPILCQPQVQLAASTHLSAIINSVSTRGASTKNGKSTDNRDRIKKNGHKQGKEKRKSVELMNIDTLSLLLKDISVRCPTQMLLDSPNAKHTNWAQCHISAASFFENKTAPLTPSSYRPLSSTINNACHDPLFKKMFRSMIQNCQYHQTRGFKSRRSTGTTGINSDRHISEQKPLGTFGISEGINQKSESGFNSSEHKTGTETREERLIREISRTFHEGYSKGAKPKGVGTYVRYFILALLLLWAMGFIEIGISSEDIADSIGMKSSRRFEVNTEIVDVTFDDVRGAYEAKEELNDIVHFLKDPEKYTALGAKLPKGVLLIGPPGVGKTLLARAVAGEAGVPFIYASGSEFDEMFVGVGARRVRNLFSTAKENAPCIIFLDEFDSVGSKRTNTPMNPHANQTINQLLNELDGFKQNEGIIVMAATNMVKNLDKAVRRPGRFDVEVNVSLPNLKARKEILELYVSKIKKDPTVDVDKLAKATPGFSGAELENLVNQAALRAVIDLHDTVNMDHFEFARDKLTMGPARQHQLADDATNRTTAYHEAGHTLVAYFTKDATPLHKVTMLPRGQSLGHTAFMQDKEVLQQTVAELKARLDVAMGGRVAEELIFGTEQVTTGASSDLSSATNVATMMVTRAGMSDKVGLRVFGDDMNGDLSPSQREVIDGEIKRLMNESYERAKAILKQHKTELVNLAEAILEHETLNKEEITAVVEGKGLIKNKT